MKTLTSLILIMLVTTSFSFAQSGEGQNSMLLAKADTEISPVRDTVTDREGSSDISLFVRNELEAANNPDRSYESPSLNIEDLPMVMSSTDKTTMSIVLPPFVYFKQQF